MGTQLRDICEPLECGSEEHAGLAGGCLSLDPLLIGRCCGARVLFSVVSSDHDIRKKVNVGPGVARMSDSRS